MAQHIAPPIGIIPENLAIEKAKGNLDNGRRLADLSEAIKRHLEANYPINEKLVFYRTLWVKHSGQQHGQSGVRITAPNRPKHPQGCRRVFALPDDGRQTNHTRHRRRKEYTMLMFSEGAVTTTSRKALALIETPAATRSWQPLSHSLAVETIIDRASRMGLTPKRCFFKTQDGNMDVDTPTMTDSMDVVADRKRVLVKNARLFGTIDFDGIDGFPADCVPSIGIRNSNNKSYSLSILIGARVMVCSNGMLSAEFQTHRKHTSGLNLNHTVDMALEAFILNSKRFGAYADRLKSANLPDSRAKELVVDLAEAGAIPSSLILPVLAEYMTPRHEEFKAKNVWGIYQATTQCMKEMSLARQFEGFIALNQVISSQFAA